MSGIDQSATLKDVALIVCKALKDGGIDAVLTGGAVVSIYTDNRYMSFDLDFVTHGSRKNIEAVMNEIGFVKTKSRYFEHPDTEFFVEFPSPPLAIGGTPIDRFEEIESAKGYLKLLTPTHSVMDRLAAWYHWNDGQSLEQAIMVANNYTVDMSEIESWSETEGMKEKFMKFKDRLKE